MSEEIKKLLTKDIQVIAVICNQFGDTGKGKFSDYLASDWADVVVRGTGGNNAGHTVVVNNRQRIFHLIPAGITQDERGVINILGNGMVIDLQVLNQELDELESEGVSFKNLMVSKDAHVIMPYHIDHDKAKHQSQKEGGIGSTGRGIGPCYSDKIARYGIMVKDLFDKKQLKKRIKKASLSYPEQKIDADKVIKELEPFAERINPFVKDTVTEMRKFHSQGKKILLEGAQGILLSIEHGTYPYVTSSDCSLNGTASGAGLSAKDVDLPLGIIKFPMMTRVGAGPFPTELGGKESEKYCSNEEYVNSWELEHHNVPHEIIEDKAKYKHNDPKIIEMINSEDEFTQGVGLRLIAGEYGATTARPRRVGWTDAVAIRYAKQINGPFFVLTKVDCLSGSDNFKICYGYEDQEKKDNEKENKNNKEGNQITEEFSRDENFLRRVTPKYKTYDGFKEDISKITEYDKLPESLRQAIDDFEEFTGGKVVIVSVGPERDQTIVR